MSREERDKWNGIYRERGRDDREPSPFVVSLDDRLPRRGSALDVAGGSGRHAVWLASRGLDVTLVDVSQAGADLARTRAREAGVSLTILVGDLAEEDALPPGPWDVILCYHFLERPVWRVFPRQLGPGGLLVIVHPTRANLERHGKPGLRYLLEDGELPTLVLGLETLHYDEGWNDEDRHEARLVARKRELPRVDDE